MKFNVRAVALAGAILWGVCVLGAAIANAATGGYAQRFLELLASIYPGYHVGHSAGQIVLVAVYAALDGLIGGLVFAWLQNSLICREIPK